MDIRKFHYLPEFVSKQYPKTFAFLILRILGLFAREICKFLKK